MFFPLAAYFLVDGSHCLNPWGPFWRMAVNDSWTFSKYQVMGAFWFSSFPCHCLCKGPELPSLPAFSVLAPVLLSPVSASEPCASPTLSQPFWVMCSLLTGPLMFFPGLHFCIGSEALCYILLMEGYSVLIHALLSEILFLLLAWKY